MHRSLPLLLAISSFIPALVLAEDAPAGTFKPLVDHIELNDGDSFVFLGDSITHECFYTQYIEDYYYTRHPKTRLHFHNAGVGGDRASNALVRFDEDVASFKPKYVTILLGMNDGAYTRYEQGIFDNYQRDMGKVLDRIAEIGAVAIPMSPTMHDARAAREHNHGAEPRDTYYNGVLALYGAWLREQAQVRGIGFADLWTPLNDITMDQRKMKPEFTLMPDAVHPTPAGEAIMAISLLHDMVPSTNVSEAVISSQEGQSGWRAEHGTVGNVKRTESSASFDFAAESLPWVLPAEASEGAKLAHMSEYTVEKLTIQDLAPGKYILKIDGTEVGRYRSGELAGGIDLGGNDKTPEYQQAAHIAVLNKRKTDEAVRPMRDQWAQLKNKRREVEKAEESNAPDAADKKTALEQWMPTFHTAVEDLLKKADAIEDQIYKENLPQSHHYEVTLEQ